MQRTATASGGALVRMKVAVAVSAADRPHVMQRGRSTRWWLSTAAGVLWLAVALATAAVWARSYWVYDTVGRYATTLRLDAHSVRGRMWVNVYPHKPWMGNPGSYVRWDRHPPRLGSPAAGVRLPWWVAVGFGFDVFRGPDGTEYALRVPHWATVGATAAWPLALFWRRLRRRRRLNINRCQECG